MAMIAVLAATGHVFCETCADAAARIVHDRPTPKVFPLRLDAVALINGSQEAQAMALNTDYMRMLPVDRLAYNFRNTSGLDLKGAEPFGGWETPYGPIGDDRGHFTGHYLSASALYVNATNDPLMRARTGELVTALAECQTANADRYPKFGPGYLSGFPTEYFDCLENLWRKPCRYQQVPYYNVHKIMQGMLDQWRLLGNEKAFAVVEGMAGYFYRRIQNVIKVNGTEVWEQVLGTEAGGMNDVMYQLYDVTGNPDHLKMAHLFDKQRWFGPLINGTDNLGGNHANTHLALTVGGAERYNAVADQSFKTAIEFFMETLQTAHSYSTGGSNYREYWQNAHSQGSAIDSPTDHVSGHDTEESCTAYNFLKILRHLFRWSGNPAHMEMYNHALRNGVLGIQRGPHYPGEMLYLLPLGKGVTKGNSTRGWGTPFDSFWCCYGTAIESFSKLGDSIYFRDADGGLTVTRVSASRVVFDAPSGQVVVEQSGDDTMTGNANLTIVNSTAVSPFNLRVLVPSWAVSPRFTVNGEPTSPQPGTFAVFHRVWAAGDTVQIIFPRAITIQRLDDSRPQYATMGSFVFGDVLLVGLESEYEADNKLITPPHPLSEWVVRQPIHDSLQFVAMARNRNLTLVPLNTVSDERYTVYYNMTAGS